MLRHRRAPTRRRRPPRHSGVPVWTANGFKRKSRMWVETFQGVLGGAAHAEIVVKMPGIRRYVQSHMRLSGYRKGEPI